MIMIIIMMDSLTIAKLVAVLIFCSTLRTIDEKPREEQEKYLKKIMEEMQKVTIAEPLVAPESSDDDDDNEEDENDIEDEDVSDENADEEVTVEPQQDTEGENDTEDEDVSDEDADEEVADEPRNFTRGNFARMRANTSVYHRVDVILNCRGYQNMNPDNQRTMIFDIDAPDGFTLCRFCKHL